LVFLAENNYLIGIQLIGILFIFRLFRFKLVLLRIIRVGIMISLPLPYAINTEIKTQSTTAKTKGKPSRAPIL
jgi:hypothetical protein